MYREIIDVFRDLKGKRRKMFEKHYKKFVDDIVSINNHYELLEFINSFEEPVVVYIDERDDIKNADCLDLHNFKCYLYTKILKLIVDSGEKDISEILEYDTSDEDLITFEDWYNIGDELDYFNKNYDAKIKWFETKGFEIFDVSVVIDFVNSIVDRLKNVKVERLKKEMVDTSY